MIRTKHPISMKFGKGGIQADITIPAGTRVSACADGTGQYFVEDLSWLDRNSMTWHDANYYGIRLTPSQIEGYNPVDKIEAYAVIIRAIHERGPTQEESLDELKRRGLWLSEEQAQQAGVSRERAGLGRKS